MTGKICIGFVFVWFAFGGVGHFVSTDVFLRIVPEWVPWPRATVLISGVCELLGAAGLLYPPMRHLAAWGLFVLTICVTPANVYMWQHASLFPNVPPLALLLRLPLQLVLLVVIYYCTRLDSDRTNRGVRSPS